MVYGWDLADVALEMHGQIAAALTSRAMTRCGGESVLMASWFELLQSGWELLPVRQVAVPHLCQRTMMPHVSASLVHDFSFEWAFMAMVKSAEK